VSFGTTFFHIQSILAFRKQRKNISKYNSTWLFILARHEDKRIDILVVVQDLELEMTRALYGFLCNFGIQYIVGRLC